MVSSSVLQSPSPVRSVFSVSVAQCPWTQLFSSNETVSWACSTGFIYFECDTQSSLIPSKDPRCCIQRTSCIVTLTKRTNLCSLNNKHRRACISNVDAHARVLTLYWIVFLIVSFVPRSKDNRLCLKSIGSADDPWSRHKHQDCQNSR